MSSWISHFRTPPASLTVLGMNAAELARNPMATASRRPRPQRRPAPAVRRRHVRRRDVLRVGRLPRAARSRCSPTSARVLRPGGLFVCTFSNRCFPTKAIKGWLANDDMGRLAIVRAYFEASGAFAEPTLAHCNPGAPGDPLYAAWAAAELTAVEADVVALPGCPRLVAWREQVAVEQAGRVPRRDVLGSAGARASATRRRAHRRARPGAGRPRRQPHRPRVHRRPQRRLPVRVDAPRRARQPADVGRTPATGSRSTGRGSRRR